MSQMGTFISGGSGGAQIITLTGNVGGAVSPTGLGNVSIVGTDPITVTGNPAAWTLTITVANATTTQIGVSELATDAETTTGTDTTRTVTPSALKAKLGLQTQYGIPYGATTTSAIAWTGAGADGELLIAATGAIPSFAALTSSGGFITFTPGANTLDLNTAGSVAVSFDGDGGTATPVLGVLNIVGGNNITTAAAASTVTINVTGTTQYAIQVGDATGSLDSLAVGTTNTVLLGNTGANPSWGQVDLTTDVTGILPVANGGTGLATITDHGVVVGSGAGVVTPLAVGTDGQCLLGSTGADPVFATLASAGSTITFTPGAGTLNLETAGTIAGSFPTDSGTATPAAGALTVAGGTNIATSGAGSTVTVAFSGTLPVGSGGTGLATITDHGVMVGSGAGNITPLAVGTNGQCLLGSTGADPVFATLTSSGGTVTFTPGAGTLNLEAAGGGISWTEVTAASVSMAVNNGYVCNNAAQVDCTLPAAAAIGDIVRVTGQSALGWQISQNAGQVIKFTAAVESTVGVGGTVTSIDRYDSIELICVIANTTWSVLSISGNVTVV